MARIQGLVESGVMTTSRLLKTGPGYVFSITIAWTGRTAGDQCILRDGTSATAAPLVVFSVPTAAGTITREWSNGKEFLTGLYYDEGSGFITEITYK